MSDLENSFKIWLKLFTLETSLSIELGTKGSHTSSSIQFFLVHSLVQGGIFIRRRSHLPSALPEGELQSDIWKFTGYRLGL